MDDVMSLQHGLNADNSVRQGADSQLVVVFYKRAVHNDYRSRSEGTPIYEQQDYVKIYQPGERDVVDRPVNDLDKRRFAQNWAAYQQNKEQQAEGTPLEHLFPGNPEVVATLKAMRIHTVQQLRGLSDTASANLQFGDDLRKKAQQYLEGVEKGKGFHALEKQVADQAATIKELKEQMAALTAAAAAKKADDANGARQAKTA